MIAYLDVGHREGAAIALSCSTRHAHLRRRQALDQRSARTGQDPPNGRRVDLKRALSALLRVNDPKLLTILNLLPIA